MHELRTTRRVEFADTDMAGIVHFSRFFVFMETAEHQFLEALGTDVHFDHDGRHIGWPRVAASCTYSRPARLGDVLDIHVEVGRKGRSSMTYNVNFACDGQLVARGQITSICCSLGASHNERDTRLEKVPIPDFLARKIEEAPSDQSKQSR